MGEPQFWKQPENSFLWRTQTRLPSWRIAGSLLGLRAKPIIYPSERFVNCGLPTPSERGSQPCARLVVIQLSPWCHSHWGDYLVRRSLGPGLQAGRTALPATPKYTDFGLVHTCVARLAPTEVEQACHPDDNSSQRTLVGSHRRLEGLRPEQSWHPGTKLTPPVSGFLLGCKPLWCRTPPSLSILHRQK